MDSSSQQCRAPEALSSGLLRISRSRKLERPLQSWKTHTRRNAIAVLTERTRSRTCPASLPLFTVHASPGRPVMIPTWCRQTTTTPKSGLAYPNTAPATTRTMLWAAGFRRSRDSDSYYGECHDCASAVRYGMLTVRVRMTRRDGTARASRDDAVDVLAPL
jgi:hypothetical protein